MNAIIPSNDTAKRLRDAIEDGVLQGTDADRAEQFISRLKSPVRVAIMGPRRSGKSSVLNLLAGAHVAQAGLTLPTLQLTYGPTKTTCVSPKGERRTVLGTNPEDFAKGRPIFIEMQRDLSALQTVALLEVVADGTLEQRAKAVSWASKRCDIAIWCTSTFDAEEQAVWSRMPDALRKHAYLVLTRADELGDATSVRNRLQSLNEVAANNFATLRPIAAPMGLRAILDNGNIEPSDFAKSGAQALVEDILGKVNAGRQKVRDAAQALLDEKVSAAPVLSPVVDSPSEGIAVAGDETQPDRAVPDEKAEIEVANDATIARLRTLLDEPDSPEPAQKTTTAPTNTSPEVATAQKEPKRADVVDADVDAFVFDNGKSEEPQAETPEQAAPLSELARQTLENVVQYLTDRGAELSGDLAEQGHEGIQGVMSGLLEDALWLTDYLSDPSLSDVSVLDDTRSAANDIADLIQLMEMENNAAATVEAGLLLLQAKRDMQSLLAA